MSAALIVVDMQQGFRLEEAYWGPRNHPGAEANMERLIALWRERGWPLVVVRHDSVEPRSPLRPELPGNELETFVQGPASLSIRKTVNSAFYGDPELHQWLQSEGIEDVVIIGATVNHCCESTARMAANLGYQVRFVIDAMFTHDRKTPSGDVLSADQLTQATAASLHEEFATVCSTNDVLAAVV